MHNPKTLSPWITLDDYCAGRVFVATDPDVIANRVAFIEKTARVRIAPSVEGQEREDWKNWMCADWKGDGSDDPESRNWCDEQLIAMGYTLL